MVFFNYAHQQLAAKIVYYGPGLSGKTTNLQYIYKKTHPKARGELVSLETDVDRTLFFDLLPLEVGKIKNFNVRFQLYTVPGQVHYNETRKLVLKGVDGIVFVADSQEALLEANIESLENLKQNLAFYNVRLEDIPLVFQYNKRDLPTALPVEVLQEKLNYLKRPYFEAIAIKGIGVFETLKGISRLTLAEIKKKLEEREEREAEEAAKLEEKTSPAYEEEDTIILRTKEPEEEDETARLVRVTPQVTEKTEQVKGEEEEVFKELTPNEKEEVGAEPEEILELDIEGEKEEEELGAELLSIAEEEEEKKAQEEAVSVAEEEKEEELEEPEVEFAQEDSPAPTEKVKVRRITLDLVKAEEELDQLIKNIIFETKEKKKPGKVQTVDFDKLFEEVLISEKTIRKTLEFELPLEKLQACKELVVSIKPSGSEEIFEHKINIKGLSKEVRLLRLKLEVKMKGK